MDEAGRGPLAGPGVASAVIVRDFSFLSRVDDSKKMSAAARREAYQEILEKCSIGIGIVEPDKIDTLNIFQATMQAMRDAIGKLKEKPDCVLIAGPYGPAELSIRKFPIVDCEALSFSIACASVVAKVTRDRMMEYYDDLFPRYGFRKHKGYGTKEHLAALKVHGPCEIHRKSFEPVKSLWKHY